jgi:Kdo2-lipid IVA lauroyltransferase/acyltransferase
VPSQRNWPSSDDIHRCKVPSIHALRYHEPIIRGKTDLDPSSKLRDHSAMDADGPETNQPKQKWFDYPAYLALRLVLCMLQSMETDRIDRLCKHLAWLLAVPLRIKKSLIHENLKRVFPDWTESQIKQTKLQMWLHLTRMIAEIAMARRKVHRSNWYEHFRILDRPKILAYIFDSRPKLIVTGHFGNFELAGYVTGVFGLPSTTMARELDNRYVFEYLNRFRTSGGQHFLSKQAGAAAVQELLDQGKTITLLTDQEAGSRGVWVNFLGHPASCHKALALFTLSSGAPMMVIVNRRLNDFLKFELQAVDFVDPQWTGDPRLESIESITCWYNDCLEQVVRKNPEQYWWVHRRWRVPPPRLRKKATRAA